MAATITRAPLSRLQPSSFLIGQHCVWQCTPVYISSAERFKSTKTVVKSNRGDDLPVDRKVDFDAQSLAARGYLRNQKAYTPPKDVKSKVLDICKKHMGNETLFPDFKTKFSVLVQCSQSLQHSVPNSLIHRINNIDELIVYYATPVSTTVPLDMMKDMDLPKNLHVVYKYHRFHPETDTKFGGITAFPNDSTLVTSIKYKKKYPSYIVEKPWLSKN
ncbi:hypothetical protein SK128_009019 [Halocaridina rubra]|uniref:Large ribosomal subunit protein mL50 n=1 Tax=Halocaridina rubra TaxID=373956 RepID=A0AAN8X5V4_HALRR